MPEPLIHQSVRDQSADAEKPGRRIACGADITTVQHTPICAQVTCPKCREWQGKVVEAVFTPLTR
jgi:hypothetical protein